MAKKKEKLPKTLYVFRETGTAGETWFTAYEDVRDCANMEEKRLVGIYELRSTVKVYVEVSTKVV